MPSYPSYSYPRLHPSLLHPSPTRDSSPVSHSSSEQTCTEWLCREGSSRNHRDASVPDFHPCPWASGTWSPRLQNRLLIDTVKEGRLLFNFKDQSLTLSACKSYFCLCRNLLVSRGLWFTQPGLSPVLSAASLMLGCAQKYSAETWKQLTVSQGALFSNRSILLRLLW